MYLPDVNVWLALAFEVHVHHRRALEWFDTLPPRSCGFCRLTQQGFLRLASNPAVLKDSAVTLDEAWSCYDALLGDDRVFVLTEPAGLEANWRRHTQRQSYSHRVWSDAYLAAFAEKSSLRVVTLDRGIRDYAEAQAVVLDG